MLETIMSLRIPLYAMAAVGCMGMLGMLATNLTYRRIIRNTEKLHNLKEKWLNLWKSRDRLLHRMNRFVWYPSMISFLLLGLAIFLNTWLDMREGLSIGYLYIGAAVPVFLMVLRQGLDFSYKEELVMATLADYVEQMRTWVEEVPAAEKTDPVLREEIVDRITESIRQTAATGSHFSKMLTPEEEEIMREIIREFMN
nr:hypothetical protein [uncultured Blautia sp.]